MVVAGISRDPKRNNEEATMKGSKTGFNPNRDFEETLQHFLSSGKHPPQRTKLELNKVLRSVNTAPASFADILDAKPVPSRDRGELTRIISHVVFTRMRDNKQLKGLGPKTAEYREAVGEIDEIERIRLNNDIKRVKLLYVPFSPVRNLAFWWWDETIKGEAEATLYDAELPLELVYALACGVVSELPDISESRRKALQRDYRWATYHIGRVDAMLDLAIAEVKEALCIKGSGVQA